MVPPIHCLLQLMSVLLLLGHRPLTPEPPDVQTYACRCIRHNLASLGSHRLTGHHGSPRMLLSNRPPKNFTINSRSTSLSVVGERLGELPVSQTQHVTTRYDLEERLGLRGDQTICDQKGTPCLLLVGRVIVVITNSRHRMLHPKSLDQPASRPHKSPRSRRSS